MPGSRSEGDGVVWRKNRTGDDQYFYSGDPYNPVQYDSYTEYDVGTQTETQSGDETFTVGEGTIAYVKYYDILREDPVPVLPGETVDIDPSGLFSGNEARIYDLENPSEVSVDAEPRGKNIVLLGDGEHNQGRPLPETAAEYADSLNITVYTVGLGTDLQDSGGEQTLKDVANATGGEYFFAETPISWPRSSATSRTK